MTRYKCVRCGKLTAGRKPKGGDGTFIYPRIHRLPSVVNTGKRGVLCPGNWEEAEWVEARTATAAGGAEAGA